MSKGVGIEKEGAVSRENDDQSDKGNRDDTSDEEDISEEDVFAEFFGKKSMSKSGSSSSLDLAKELTKKTFTYNDVEDEVEDVQNSSVETVTARIESSDETVTPHQTTCTKPDTDDDVFRTPSPSSPVTTVQGGVNTKEDMQKPPDDNEDDYHAPGTKIIFCKEVPMDPTLTWDFSLQALMPNYKSKCLWLEGTAYQKLHGECFHEMENVSCACHEKKKIAICRICYQPFCSTQCFKKSIKLKTGAVSEDEDEEPRPAESQPEVEANPGSGVVTMEKTASDLKLGKERPKPELLGSTANKKTAYDKVPSSNQNAESSIDKRNQRQQLNSRDGGGGPYKPRNSDSRRMPQQTYPGGIPPQNLWPTQVQMNSAYLNQGGILGNPVRPPGLPLTMPYHPVGGNPLNMPLSTRPPHMVPSTRPPLIIQATRPPLIAQPPIQPTMPFGNVAGQQLMDLISQGSINNSIPANHSNIKNDVRGDRKDPRVREPHKTVSMSDNTKCQENPDSKPCRDFEEPVKILRNPGPPSQTAVKQGNSQPFPKRDYEEAHLMYKTQNFPMTNNATVSNVGPNQSANNYNSSSCENKEPFPRSKQNSTTGSETSRSSSVANRIGNDGGYHPVQHREPIPSQQSRSALEDQKLKTQMYGGNPYPTEISQSEQFSQRQSNNLNKSPNNQNFKDKSARNRNSKNFRKENTGDQLDSFQPSSKNSSASSVAGRGRESEYPNQRSSENSFSSLNNKQSRGGAESSRQSEVDSYKTAQESFTTRNSNDRYGGNGERLGHISPQFSGGSLAHNSFKNNRRGGNSSDRQSDKNLKSRLYPDSITSSDSSTTSSSSASKSGHRFSTCSSLNSESETSQSRIRLDPDIPYGVLMPVKYIQGLSFFDFSVMTLPNFDAFLTLHAALQDIKKTEMRIFEVGDWCIVKYQALDRDKDSTLEKWYRGTITKVVGRVGVYLLDIGADIVVNPNTIYELPSDFKSCRPLGIRFKSLNIKNLNEDDEEVRANFNSWVCGSPIKVRITHTDTLERFKYAGHLYVTHINKLFDAGVLMRKFQLAEIGSSEDIRKEENEQLIKPLPIPEAPVVELPYNSDSSKEFSASITYIKSLIEFYVSTPGMISRRNRIEKQMNGLGVAMKAKSVLSLEDLAFPLFMMTDEASESWIRVKILEVAEISDPVSVVVQKLDYGEVRTVPLQNLKQLPQNFYQPSCVYKCSLPVEPITVGRRKKLSFEDDAKRYLDELFNQNVILDILVLSVDQSNTHLVELFLEKSNQTGCVYSLVHKGLVKLSSNIQLASLKKILN